MSRAFTHDSKEIERTVSAFFALRQRIRYALIHGQTPSLWLRVVVLKYIALKKEVRVKDIAQFVSVTVPSISSLLRTIEENGLVVRRTDGNDKRSSLFSLTKKGKQELAHGLADGVKQLTELFAPVSKEELQQLTNALETIRKRIGDDATLETHG